MYENFITDSGLESLDCSTKNGRKKTRQCEPWSAVDVNHSNTYHDTSNHCFKLELGGKAHEYSMNVNWK